MGQGIFHAHLAACDGAESEEGDDLVVVGGDGEHAALELRDAGDGELAGAEAGDLRAHAGEHGAEILHVRFAGGVEEDGLALGEDGGHDEILGGGDGHVVRPVAGAAEAALERHLQVAVVGDLGAEFLEDLEMRIEFADAEGAALGVGRQRDLLHALQERREEEDGRAHARWELAVEAAGVEVRVVEGDGAGGTIPSDDGALLGEEGDEFLDVGDVRDVAEDDLGVGEQRRAEDGQD